MYHYLSYISQRTLTLHVSHPLAIQVNSGATLAGILFYRGEVKSNIKEQMPINEWDFSPALSYFCSNVNENLSFSSHFRQTRARLYLAATAKYESSATKMQDLYMVACAEERNSTHITKRGFKPTHYRERFIHDLQKSPDDFEIFTQNRYKGILKDMHKLIDGWKAVQTDFDPSNARHRKLAQIGPDLVAFFETELRCGGDKPAGIPGVSPSDTISLDVTKY